MAYFRCTGNSGGSLKLRTAQGEIATFETNIIDTLQEVKCSINPVQDLHGEDKPYPAGGGMQKWDEVWELGALNGNTGGNYPSSTSIRSTNYIPVEPDTSYYYKIPTGYINVYQYGSDKSFLGTNKVKGNIANQSFTTDSACYYIRLEINSAYGTTYHNDISINYPYTNTDYHPYENICPFIGIDELNIQRTGANLLGGLRLAETFSSCFGYTLDTTEKTFTFSRTWATGAPYYRPLITGIFKPNTVYTLMGYYKANAENQCLKVQYTDNTNQRFVIPPSNSKVAFAFSTRSDKTVESIGVDWYADGLVTLYYDECGLFEGVKTIDELNPYSGKLIKLEFDDTVYLAEVSCLNGVWKLKLLGAEVDLGDLNWTHRTDVSQGVFAAQLPDYKFSSDVYAICENYEFRGTAVSSTIVSHGNDCILLYFDNQQTARYVYVYDTAYSDANTFKTAMDGVKFVYELATPIEITLDETEQFEALLGVNNVWHDGNGDTEVKYLYNA